MKHQNPRTGIETSNSVPDQRRTRQEKRLLFALLSSLIPGSGQLAAGYRTRGAIMLAVSFVVLVAALALYQQGTTRILSYLVQPEILIGLFILNIAILAFRLISVQPDSPLHAIEGLKFMETAIVPGIYDPALADPEDALRTVAARPGWDEHMQPQEA
jgi:hypothetical protein